MLAISPVHPLKMIGWEGLWGSVLYFMMLPLLQVIPCDSNLCSNGKVEDTIQALDQIINSSYIALLCVGIIISVAFLNSFGLAVTKYASASQRSTVDASRMVLIWIFFLAYPGSG